MRLLRTSLALPVAALVLAGPGASGASPPASATCAARVQPRLLPVWARAGFSDPRPRMPYVLGRDGAIAAILWADPLLSPPSHNHSNKILWVSRLPVELTSTLRISAQRVSGSKPVGSPVKRSVFGGPGPSIVNLPEPGCYELTLSWSGRTDSMRLAYLDNR